MCCHHVYHELLCLCTTSSEIIMLMRHLQMIQNPRLFKQKQWIIHIRNREKQTNISQWASPGYLGKKGIHSMLCCHCQRVQNNLCHVRRTLWSSASSGRSFRGSLVPYHSSLICQPGMSYSTQSSLCRYSLLGIINTRYKASNFV